ncbi:MAG TPA: hypothetical protein DCR10_03850, partial [Acidimicrobiaceae bacterium]|nr:hypothetical protein [Acidimicrobiaceae bacterium]
HDVLAAADAGFITHEAHVQQPHEHDGDEVIVLNEHGVDTHTATSLAEDRTDALMCSVPLAAGDVPRDLYPHPGFHGLPTGSLSGRNEP